MKCWILLVCCLGLAQAAPMSDVEELKKLLMGVLHERTMSSEEESECPPALATSMFAFLDLEGECPPSIPEENFVNRFLTKITDLEDPDIVDFDLGTAEALLQDVSDMLHDINNEFADNSVGADYEDAMEMLKTVHGKFIARTLKKANERLFKIGTAVYRVAIAGVDVPDLGEAGCIDIADANKQKACFLVKSMAVDRAIEMWGAKARDGLKQSPFRHCKKMYEVEKTPAEERTYGLVARAVAETSTCLKDNYGPIRDFIADEPKNLDGRVLPRLLASLTQTGLILDQLHGLTHAGRFLVDHAQRDD